MSKNADTITMGGTRFDCGPKVLEKISKARKEFNTDLFIKPATNKDTYIDGFEASLEVMNFR